MEKKQKHEKLDENNLLKLRWVRVDERNDTSVFPAVFFQSGTGEGPMKRALGASLAALMQSFEGRKWVWYEIEGDLQRVGAELTAKIEGNPGFVDGAIKETYRRARELLELTGEIASADLTKKSDDELADYYAEYGRRLEEMRGPAWIAPALDASEYFSNHLKEILRGYLKKIGKESELAQYFVTLTAPNKQTLMAQNDEALFKIAAQIAETAEQARFFKENDLNRVLAALPQRFPELNEKFEAHVREFEWLPCTYENDAWNKRYFVSIVQGLVKTVNPKEELDKIEEKKKRGEEAKKRAFEELRMSAQDRKWFEVAQELIFFKADRKDVFFKSYFQMRPLLREIAARLKLSLQEARMMLPIEVDEYLRSGSVSIAFRDELLGRKAFSVLLSFNDDSVILTGAEAQRYLKENLVEEKTEARQPSELKGSCANTGHARGLARLIFSPTDMPKMKQGEILVAPATNPDVVPAMKKAAAIVTNTGGITCHAAIVSRELGIPCVVGTKRATDVIRDGDEVEVDADKGIVKIIKRA